MGLLNLDIDSLRFLLVISVLVGSVVYAIWHLSAGGVFTGGYVLILALVGEWLVLAAVIVICFLSLLLVKQFAIRFFALSKLWLFYSFVLIGAVLMACLTVASAQATSMANPGELTIVLVIGAYITPGLLAFNIAHQGLRKTFIGVGAVVVGSVVIAVPVISLADFIYPLTTTPLVTGFGEIPAGLYWLVVLASILFSGALRLSFGLRSGGFVGAVFIVQMLSVAAVIAIVSSAIIAHVIAKFLARRIVFSPRQEFQLALLIGMMVAWTSLYWASLMGWIPALAANAYALQPLLAVGLLAADMGRTDSSMVKSLIGISVVVGFLAIVLFAATGSGFIAGASTALLVIGVPLILIMPAVRTTVRNWRLSEEVGRQEAQALLNSHDRNG
jgi:hypothetical protein